MTRLPVPGSDDGTWGTLLNDFLAQSHNNDGTLKAGAVSTTQLQDSSISAAKLDTNTQASLTKATNAVQTVNSKAPNGSGAVTLSANDVGAPTTIAALTDVSISGPSDSQVLAYNASTHKWSPSNVGSATVSDASNSQKGIVQLAGDLAGSNDPTNPKLTDGVITSAKITAGGLAPSSITGTALINSQLGTANGVAALDGTSKLAQNIDAGNVTSGTLNASRLPDLSGTYATASSISGKLDESTADGRYIRTVNNQTANGSGNVSITPGAAYVSWNGTGSAPTRPATATGEVDWAFPAANDPATHTTVQDGDTWEYTVTDSGPATSVIILGTASKFATNASVTVNQSDFSTAPQSGNLLVAFLWQNSSDTTGHRLPNTPSGWTSQQSASNSSLAEATGIVLTRVAGSSEGSYTFTAPGVATDILVEIYVLTGADTTTIFDGGGPPLHVLNGQGSSQNVPSVTPDTGVNSLLLACWCSFTTSSETITYTAPSGMTKDIDTGVWSASNNVGLWASSAHKTLSSNSATGTQLATASASELFSSFVMAILVGGNVEIPRLVRLIRRGGAWITTNNPGDVTSVAGRTGDVTLTGSDITDLATYLDPKESTANKGIANGYAGLDINGTLAVAQIPATVVKTVNGVTPTAGNVNIAGSTDNFANGTVPFHSHDHLVQPAPVPYHTSSMQASDFLLTHGAYCFVLNSNAQFTLNPAVPGATNDWSITAALRDSLGPLGPIVGGVPDIRQWEMQTEIFVVIVQDEVGGHSCNFNPIFDGAPVTMATNASVAVVTNTSANTASFFRFRWMGIQFGWVGENLYSGQTLLYPMLPSSTTTYIRGYRAGGWDSAYSSYTNTLIGALMKVPLVTRKYLYSQGYIVEFSANSSAASLVIEGAQTSSALPGFTIPALGTTLYSSLNGGSQSPPNTWDVIHPTIHETGHAMDYTFYRNGVTLNGTAYYNVHDDPTLVAMYTDAKTRGTWSGQNRYFLDDNYIPGSNGKLEWFAQNLACYAYSVYLTANSQTDSVLANNWIQASPTDIQASFASYAQAHLSTWIS